MITDINPIRLVSFRSLCRLQSQKPNCYSILFASTTTTEGHHNAIAMTTFTTDSSENSKHSNYISNIFQRIHTYLPYRWIAFRVFRFFLFNIIWKQWNASHRRCVPGQSAACVCCLLSVACFELHGFLNEYTNLHFKMKYFYRKSFPYLSPYFRVSPFSCLFWFWFDGMELTGR